MKLVWNSLSRGEKHFVVDGFYAKDGKVVLYNNIPNSFQQDVLLIIQLEPGDYVGKTAINLAPGEYLEVVDVPRD
jgi:hypothetical protein